MRSNMKIEVNGEKLTYEERCRYKGDKPMKTKEEKAHLHAPCPICGKLNEPYSYIDTLFGERVYYYKCSNTDRWRNVDKDYLDVHVIEGCETKWEVKVKPKEMFKKYNLQLDSEEVRYLGSIFSADNPDMNFRIMEKQKAFWIPYYRADSKKPFHIRIYLRFLHWISDLCKR